MQVAVSRQLDFGTDTSGLGINAEHSRPAQNIRRSPMCLELIPTVQFADVELALVKADAIVPRQRDEVVSRVLNVVVASVALILLSPVLRARCASDCVDLAGLSTLFAGSRRHGSPMALYPGL